MQERGITPKALSAATGIPTSTLSEWTAGRDPRLGQPLLKLARFFGVSIEYLVTGEESVQEAVGAMLGGMGEDFVSIHQGVYRVNIERLHPGGSKKRKGDSI
jgi:transcriptional regulator with XRE-family HTH domain